MLRATGYNKGAVSAQTSPHPRYHFHGYADDQITGDSKFFDRTALGNHGVRGANLTEAQMFANAGYMSTIDPIGGATDSVIRLPNINLDYNSGEKIILWWLGKITPEGAAVEFMGDGGFSTSYAGWSIRVSTTGKMQLKLADATSTYFSGTSTSTAFDGSLHSIGVTLDGAARKACVWVDETLDALNPAGPIALNGGNPIDTRNSNTFNIGTNLPASAGSTSGIATQTRGLHILRLSTTDVMPSHAVLTNVFKQLRVNPSKPILGGAF